ncbi:LacI family DNA-binding transcriptional regulator [Streptomyces indicus]|uniref:DNA-binding transcriptional regulator, LacI/PurR family n=1 Tax=Streptomyces indicus TaxID=417292 RepID=A0A1G8UWK7_9ACTN|nr:LacI family DNA-binding transcriptional regulator [Streptomyces indicus]SDJ58024.1 DNA-binding transcriptional regulator, LacI/PurR family [Streptomyces indicus]
MTARRRGKAPSQADVARLAGVSQSAVSRVISGNAATARIPEDTRQRIFQAVRELGYVANPAARAMRGKRTNLLGVHTFERVFPHAREDFYFEFLLGIEERAEETGFDLVLFTSTGSGGSGERGERKIYKDGTNRLNMADGSILLGVSTDRGELARLWYEGYPFVHIGRREVPGAEIPQVVPDYRGASGAIVDRLAELGHRRLGYVREWLEMEPYEDRRAGYAEAVERLGLTDESPGFRGAHGIEADWLDEVAGGAATAIVVESVRLAESLRDQLAARGRKIPDDVSVAVLEAAPADLSGQWDSLVIPRTEIGRIAVDRLQAMLDDPDQRTGSLLVPCPLIPGTTVAAVGD